MAIREITNLIERAKQAITVGDDSTARFNVRLARITVKKGRTVGLKAAYELALREGWAIARERSAFLPRIKEPPSGGRIRAQLALKDILNQANSSIYSGDLEQAERWLGVAEDTTSKSEAGTPLDKAFINVASSKIAPRRVKDIFWR